jgi:hypothetical protein
MAKTFFMQLNLDTLGFWTSATCALHCLIVPVLLSRNDCKVENRARPGNEVPEGQMLST